MAEDLTGQTVGVIGLGNMGSALAGALLEARADVTVWNRTPEKAEALATKGASVAESPAALAEAVDVTLVCVTDHAAATQVLEGTGMAEALKGKVLCQVGVVTAEESRKTGVWADEHGIEYLEASILGVPDSMKNKTTMMVCSAPAGTYGLCEELFTAFGESLLVSEAQGAAYQFDKAVYAFSYSVMQGFLQGLALCHANGMSEEAFSKLIIARLPSVWPSILQGFSDAVIARNHPPENCAIAVWAEAFEKTVELSKASGVDDTLPLAIIQNFENAIEAGYGDQDFTALFEVMIPKT